jgi:adenine-specific DNA-methyltransferase
MFLFFIEIGINLLKYNGVFTFINPISMLSTDSAFGTRKLLMRKCRLSYIVDVSNFDVFKSAQTYCIVWQLSKNFVNEYSIRIHKAEGFKDIAETSFLLSSKTIKKTNKLLIATNPNATLIAKIESGRKELSEYIGNIKWGTSMAGYGKKKIKKSFYETLPSDKRTFYKPILQTADIKKYAIQWQEDYLPVSVYSDSIQLLFNKPKIVVARVTKNIQATIDRNNYYIGKSTIITDTKLPMEFLLGIMLSKLVNFWYLQKFDSTHMANGYIRFDIPYLSQIPIPNATIEQQHYIITIVNQVMTSKNGNPLADTSKEESEIDRLVYHLYGLTYDEVLTVDPETTITREQYEIIKNL